MERFLDVAASEARLATANMANIDTPGYQAQGMDFAREIRAALDGVDTGTGWDPVKVRPEDGLIARPDGNNVSMDRESLNLAEAQLHFKTGVALLRQQYQMVLDAIHADR
jgi:flagellar basal-body rod protein FlgB